MLSVITSQKFFVLPIGKMKHMFGAKGLCLRDTPDTADQSR